MQKLNAQTKAKITFGSPDLQAYFISNLLKEVNSQVKIQKQSAAQSKTDTSDNVLNTRLSLNEGQSIIFGELPISDFIINDVNAKNKANFKRLGVDLEYDHYLHLVNNSIRDKVIQGWKLKKKVNWEEVKKDAQEVHKYVGGKKENILLKVLLNSYLEPVRNEVGLNVEVSQTFEDFVKQYSERKTKEVKIDQSQVKIVRVNTSKKLPIPGKRNILITSALPYVNNVPHLGNIIGCVLSADVFARYCRLRGHNTIYICGTDEYGTATETKAIEEKKTPKEICDYYFKIHKEIYEWFDCDFEYFGRTTTQQQTVIAQDIFLKLYNNKFTFEKVVEQQYCPNCDRFLADRLVAGECPLCHFYDAKGDQCDGCGKLLNAIELIKPKCKTCGATPNVRESNHIFIDLPNIQPLHYKWFQEAQVKGNWTENSIQFTESLIKEGLQGRCITRDLKWGTPVPLENFKDKVFYVWFDAPIGYISITANYIEEWEKWWKNPENVQLYQFMGKDNITFHTVIFPSTLHGTKENWTFLHHISTTEFLNYEIDENTGKPKKFSKTRKTGVFGDDAIKTGIPSEVWRYYLLVNRPEHQDTVFLWNDFQAKNNSELLANLGNFSNRCLKYIESNFNSTVPTFTGELKEEDHLFLKKLYDIFQEFLYLMENVKIKDGLRVAMSYSQHCNGYWQDQKPWDLLKSDPNRCNQVVFVGINVLFLLCSMLEPFVPSFSAKVYQQMNWKRSDREETLYDFVHEHPERITQLIPQGHKIGTPQPIFREITNEEIKKWRSEFGGGKN